MKEEDQSCFEVAGYSPDDLNQDLVSMGEIGEVRIIVIGDSVAVSSNYPSHLVQSLEARGVVASVEDFSLPGATTEYAVDASLDIASGETRPDLVIIALGGNDLLSLRDPEETRADLHLSSEILSNSGAKVLFAGLQAPEYTTKEYKPVFDNILPELSKKTGIHHDPLFVEPIVKDPNALQHADIFFTECMVDAIHPNEDAGVLIAERMASSVLPLLREPSENLPTLTLSSKAVNEPQMN